MRALTTAVTDITRAGIPVITAGNTCFGGRFAFACALTRARHTGVTFARNSRPFALSIATPVCVCAGVVVVTCRAVFIGDFTLVCALTGTSGAGVTVARNGRPFALSAATLIGVCAGVVVIT